MERVLPRSGLNGSALVGLLAQLSLLDAPLAKPSFVDGLGRWLGWDLAIPLAAALNGPPQGPGGCAGDDPAGDDGARAAAAAAGSALAATRQALARAITDDGVRPAVPRRPGLRAPARRPADTVDAPAATDFAPYRRRCIDLQQAMERAIAPLRQRVRGAVGRRSPALGRLAAIDAVLEGVLGAQQQALLAMMPTLLQTHFDRLRQAPSRSPAAQGPNAPAPSLDWLDTFHHDMQRLLLAELELRLLPLQGLLEAADPPAPGTP